MKDKLQAEQQREQEKENQGNEKDKTPKKKPERAKTNPKPLIQNQQEEAKKESGTMEFVSEDMEIGDLDLDRMEVACSYKDPSQISPSASFPAKERHYSRQKLKFPRGSC